MTDYITSLLKDAPPEIIAEAKECLDFINANPIALSLCYDLNLMPETIDNPKDFIKMVSVAAHIKDAQEQK